MDDLLERLPPGLEMLLLQETAAPRLKQEHAPFVICALQECQRINTLLHEMRRSLADLDKGMRGQLNMSEMMEDMILAFRLNQWPGRNPFSKCTWEKFAWPSLKPLQAQFGDLLARFDQLQRWTTAMDTPRSTWLPGLFNPTAFLTAVKQVTARKNGQALDKMTNETHVTTWQDPRAVDAYPEDGMHVHGLFVEGARWTSPDESAGHTKTVGQTMCTGHLTDSRLKELLPMLPVMYVRAVPVQPQWIADAVGFQRNDPAIYECPVYLTQFRGPTFVFLATLDTVAPTHKWVLTGTAIIMQTAD